MLLHEVKITVAVNPDTLTDDEMSALADEVAGQLDLGVGAVFDRLRPMFPALTFAATEPGEA